MTVRKNNFKNKHGSTKRIIEEMTAERSWKLGSRWVRLVKGENWAGKGYGIQKQIKSRQNG